MNEQISAERLGMTPVLRMAVLFGVKASVQLHLRRGGAVDVMDDKRRTPLILAASRGHAELCQLLIDAGADLTHVDLDGNDALRMATAKGHSVVAEIIRSAASSNTEPPSAPPFVAEFKSSCSESVDACSAGEPPPSDTGINRESVTVVPQNEPDGAAAGAVAKSSCPQIPAEFDLSGWEEEPDSPAPPTDPTLTDRADELQRRLSLHVPLDLDAGWDDVEIDLPDILISVRRRAKLEGNEEAVEQLVRTALTDGRVRGEFLDWVAPRDADDPDSPDLEYVANLRIMLGDMGVVVDDDPSAPDRLSEFGDTEDENDTLREEAAEGMAFLRMLNSNSADPLTHYIGGLPRNRLTREDETSLAIEIERSTKTALAAMAMSPAAVSKLLEAVEAVVGREIPPEDLLESDQEGGDDDDEDASLDQYGDQETNGNEMLMGPPLLPGLLLRLETVRDLCRRLSLGKDGGLAQRLGDELAALGLSHAFVSQLRHAVESDPLGDEARRQMEAGLENARKARERFALANLKLVVWVTRKFGGLTWSDRIQEGNLGLLKAVERFDHRRGAKLSTYATWWIRQSVSRAVADKGHSIRIPVHVQEAMRKLRRAQNEVFVLTGREALAEEVAELTQISLSRVLRFLALSEEPTSLDVEEVGLCAAEVASSEPDPEERLAVAEIKAMVRAQLKLLRPREATVIRLRFGIGIEREYTLEEIGQKFGVTRERIRQIEAKALRKLSHPGRIKALQGCR